MMHRLLLGVHCSKSDCNDTSGTFVYNPLTPGYGITLANSLRRVLLSSIPSCGIYGIFIPGVSHQYASIEGVREDVLHIIQNLKNIDFAFLNDINDEQVVKIEFQGPGTITSNDIICDESMKVLTKDMYICSVIDSMKFECSIYIKKGAGYLGLGTSELDIDRKFAGFIPVNSIANAVKRVSYEVTNVNYSGNTDYEQLIMNIITDGNITPSEAMNTAATILMNDFASVAHASSSERKKFDHLINDVCIGGEINAKSDTHSMIDQIIYSSIRTINIPVKICAILEESGICFVGDVIAKSYDELILIPKLGVRKLQEVEKRLQEYGLAFAKS